MSEQDVAAAIAAHPFFQDMPAPLRVDLATAASRFTTSANKLIGKLGEEAKQFVLVEQGHVRLQLHTPKNGIVTIQTVGPGEVLGWSWLVPPHQWKFDCRAADDVKGIAFDGQWLREKCEKNHEFAYHLLRQLVSVMAGRLAATRVQLLDIYK